MHFRARRSLGASVRSLDYRRMAGPRVLGPDDDSAAGAIACRGIEGGADGIREAG